MTDFVKRAIGFASFHHADQKRKFSGLPYIFHPLAVMAIVSTVTSKREMLAAAVLHDVLEDTDATPSGIELAFGREVRDLVLQLTDISTPDDGNRAHRKMLDRKHLAKASPDAMTVKLADIIDNASTVVEEDPNFAKVFLMEKTLTLDVLRNGDSRLWSEAMIVVRRGLRRLEVIKRDEKIRKVEQHRARHLAGIPS